MVSRSMQYEVSHYLVCAKGWAEVALRTESFFAAFFARGTCGEEIRQYSLQGFEIRKDIAPFECSTVYSTG